LLAQQSHGQPNKAVAQKTKGTKLKQNSASLSYSIEQGREDKCWRYDGLHQKNDFPNPLQANICNVNLTDHVLIIKFMGMMKIIISPYI
jgi:hypothetical protein